MATIFKRRLIILAVALATQTPAVWAQSALRWSSYKTADGLPQAVFDAVSFTPQGKLIANRFNGALASELDGYTVSNFPAPAGCVGRICESPGGQRWALHPQGLLEYKHETWLLHPVSEISAAFRAGFLRPDHLPAFLPARQGDVFYLLPDRLMELFAENPDEARTISIRAAAETKIGAFTGMAVSRNESLWISGTRGLAKIAGPVRNLEPATAWEEYLPPETLQIGDFCQPVADFDGDITLVARSLASHEGLVVTFDGHDWATLPAGPRNFLCAWREPGQTVWAATTNALFQWAAAHTNWVEQEEISAGRISDVAVEPGGAFWLATSEGLLRGALPLWCKPGPLRGLDSPVKCLAADSRGPLYFVAGDTLHALHNDGDCEYPLPPAVQDSQTVRALFPLKNGPVLLDAENALFQFDPGNGIFHPLPKPEPNRLIKALGVLPDGAVCFYEAGEPARFDVFDGTQFHPWTNPPPVQNDDGPWTALLATRNGDVWLGGSRAVWWCHDGKWERFASEAHAAPEAAVAFAEMGDGEVWCATADELWEFNGKKWSLSPSRFNHINALIRSHDGTVWLASNGGLFRYCSGIWMENGEPEGMPNGPVYALCEDQPGRIWAASSRGLALFLPESDTSPPRTYVRWLGGSGHRLTEGDGLNVWFDGEDKWKMTSRERLLYSCQLDQQGWSAFQNLTMVSLPAPVAGRHSLQVRALNRNGNLDPVAATLDFTVVTPWFHDTRLWIALLAGAAAAIFFAAVAWNRHRQLLRSHAAVEQKVAERTRELEIATRELLHSQKMTALGTLAAGVAHDFNNILSIIKGSAQIIEDNPDQPEKIRTRVNRIKTVVQQGAEIIDAMLGFGRESDAAPLPCDVNSVVADTIKLLGDRFLREVEVKFERAEKLPEISVPREFVQQILLNFIFNAAESMNSRKTMTLTTRWVDKLPPDVVLPAAAGASFVLVCVRDRGAGIAPEIRSRIFEPFFTTKAMSTRRGTGLGLSMVYELAGKMGAGLAVQSAVGEGSTFTLILPAEDQLVDGKQAPKPVESLHV